MSNIREKGELTAIAKQLGFKKIKDGGGRHPNKFHNSETGQNIALPSDIEKKEIKQGTAISILKALGYNEVKPHVEAMLDLKPGKTLITAKHIKTAIAKGLNLKDLEGSAPISTKESQAQDWKKVKALVKLWRKSIHDAPRKGTNTLSWDDFKNANMMKPLQTTRNKVSFGT